MCALSTSLVCVWMSRLAATQHSVNVVCSCHVTCDVSRVTRTDTQSYTTTITTDGSVKNCGAVKMWTTDEQFIF